MLACLALTVAVPIVALSLTVLACFISATAVAGDP